MGYPINVCWPVIESETKSTKQIRQWVGICVRRVSKDYYRFSLDSIFHQHHVPFFEMFSKSDEY